MNFWSQVFRSQMWIYHDNLTRIKHFYNRSLPTSIFEHSQFKVLWILSSVPFEIMMNLMETIKHSVKWFLWLRVITFSRSQWSYMFLIGFVTWDFWWMLYAAYSMPSFCIQYALILLTVVFSLYRTQSMMGSLILNDAKP